MALGRTFRMLSLRPQSIHQHCRRDLARSASTQQTATERLAEQVQSPSEPAGSARTSSFNISDGLGPRAALSGADLAQQTFRSNTASPEATEKQGLKVMRRGDLEKQSARRWKAGDVYAPHDLSGAEISKWQRLRQQPRRGKQDVLDELGINPLNHYKNFSMMSEYMTEMGRIKHSRETGLRPVNQRRMAKAIRRAIGIGLIPGVHRHPEIIKRLGEIGSASLRR